MLKTLRKMIEKTVKKLFKTKENCIIYFCIFITTLLVCQNFLQMHFSSDTYVLYSLGYMKYPEKYFLLDGRLISTLVCYMAGILHIPINAYIIGVDFIGICFIATAIYTLYKILNNLIKPEKIITKISLITGSFVIILNQFTLEFLLFPESAVMCLGVLLCIVTAKVVIENKKHKYLKTFLLLLTAGICYQGIINMFPTLIIALYIVKEIIDKRDYKSKEKEFFIEMIKLAIIVISVLAICFLIVKIGINFFHSSQDRRIHMIDFEAFLWRATTVATYMDELWNENMHMLPRHFNTIVLIVNFILLIVLKTKKEMVMQFFLLLFVTFVICVAPMFLFNTGICGRVNVPLMMLWGASLIILTAQASQIENSKKENLIHIIVISSFIINSIFLMQNITEHIAANRVDDEMGRTIKYATEKYEKESGNKITKISFGYDRNPQQFATGIKKTGSLTERKFACSWCIIQATEYYLERDLKFTRLPQSVLEEHIENYMEADYDCFSEDQLVFYEDTLYILVY